MPSITVRKLDPVTWEPLNGNGQANFISDIEAVAQIIKTRLLLLMGEWFENANLGTPMFQKILGAPGAGRQPTAVSFILQNRIRSTPFVTSITSASTGWDPATRAFSFSCMVRTQFGPISVSLGPGLRIAPLNS
jgi:hypothetical protein